MAYNPRNANGSATSANSAPVVIASDQATVPISAASLPLPSGAALDATLTGGTQQARFTDGTNIGNVLKSDGTAAGQNSQMVAGSHLAATFTTTTAQTLASTDVANYSWVSVQINAQGGSSTVTFQCSNDNTNWFSQELSVSSSALAAGTTSSTTTGVWQGPLMGRYFRLNVTGIASGTTSGTIEFFTQPRSLNGAGVAAAQNGTWTVQPGNTANTTPWLNNTTQLNGTTIDTNSGVKSAGTQRVILATDQPNFTTPWNDNVAQINGVTPLMGNGVTGTGSMRVTIASDNAAIPVAAHAVTNAGTFAVQPTAAATGGYTSFTLISAASTNATSVKASAGTLGTVYAYNNGASAAYLKLYNKASAPTVGTDTPVATIYLPATGGSNVPLPTQGITFTTGIAYAITGVGTVADTTAVAATQVFVNGGYI